MDDNFGEFKAASQPSNVDSVGSFDKVYDQCKPKVLGIFVGSASLPIFLYLVLSLATNQHFGTFLVTLLLMCAFFWITKNIAGRQLAALFWYSRLTEENQEKWCFVSSKRIVPASCNVYFFWIVQLVSIVFWFLVLIVNLFLLDFFFVFLSLFCLLILSINFVLFLECKGDHQKKVNSISKKFGKEIYQLNEQAE